MSVNAPMSDLFTRIRNAILSDKDNLQIPYSNLKASVIKILQEEGFINSYEIESESLKKKFIKIKLKYFGKRRKSVISEIRDVSKISNRVYVSKGEVPKVKNGYGVSIISTSKGVLSGRAARKNNVGGEYIGFVY